MDANPAASVKKPRAAKREPYMLDAGEIGRLRAALDVPFERLLVELALTTGLRSGEIRGLTWDSVDLAGQRIFVDQQATRTGESGGTKTAAAIRVVPLASYLVPELKRWKLACPGTARGLVFPGKSNKEGERQPIEADVLLRHILRRALRRAGLPELRVHDLRHIAASLMLEAGVSLKRVQQVIGHASETTTLKIYAHVMRQKRDDATDRIAVLAGLAPSGNNRETIDDLEREESDASDGSDGGPCRTRTYNQRIKSPLLYQLS